LIKTQAAVGPDGAHQVGVSVQLGGKAEDLHEPLPVHHAHFFEQSILFTKANRGKSDNCVGVVTQNGRGLRVRLVQAHDAQVQVPTVAAQLVHESGRHAIFSLAILAEIIENQQSALFATCLLRDDAIDKLLADRFVHCYSVRLQAAP
jgi:hypothetical protein